MRREVLNAGEKTREVSIIAACSSNTQSGDPSETLLEQSVSNRYRSFILLFSSFQVVVDIEEVLLLVVETDFFVGAGTGNNSCVETTCGNERRIARARIAVAEEAQVHPQMAILEAGLRVDAEDDEF